MTWNSLIDLQYQQALQTGAFERLHGTGKPLAIRDNPFEEPEMRLANLVLRSQGCTLPWIAERNEILALLKSARERLQTAARRYDAHPEATDAWQRASSSFTSEAHTLNRRIINFNLRAPSVLVQIAPIDVDWELRRALPTPPHRIPPTSHAPSPVAVPDSYSGLLRTYLAPQWRRVVLMSVLLLLSIGAQVINPQILRSFIDTARAGGSSASLANAALLFLAAVAIGQLVSAFASYISADVGSAATNNLRADLLHHCLRLDAHFYKDHTPGELIERVDGDVSALAAFFSQFVVQVVGNTLLLIGTLAVLFAEEWRVGLALTAYVVVTGLVLQRMQGIAVPAIAAARGASAALTSFWEERLLATEDLRPNGATAYTLRQLDELLATLLRRIRADRMLFRTYVAVWAVLLGVGNALAFGVGAWLYRSGSITLGTVYMIFAYTGLLAWNLGRITDHVNELQRAAASIGRINELARARSALADGPGVALPDRALAVAFRDVSFRYEQSAANGQRWILENLSFTLAPGEVLGLVGRTGSGKTTLGRLLFRFYDPQVGQILLNGVDVRTLRLDDLRSRVALVTQNVQIFSGSVRDNLTLFDETVDDARIMQVLSDLGLDAWLQRLPSGLDSNLTGNGGVSAGEAQLLAFARVFLRNPSVVVLDEASAHLDPASEQLLEHAIDRLLQGRTAIIIAHRLTTLGRADRVMRLDDDPNQN